MSEKQKNIEGWGKPEDFFKKFSVDNIDFLCVDENRFKYNWKEIMDELKNFNPHMYFYDPEDGEFHQLCLHTGCGFVWSMGAPSEMCFYGDFSGSDNVRDYTEKELEILMGLGQLRRVLFKWEKFCPRLLPVIAAKEAGDVEYVSFFYENTKEDHKKVEKMLNFFRTTRHEKRKAKPEKELEKKRKTE